jgi:D-alanyl-D-alanine carboxypeptidase (penicillin-binding protein 5/6)
MRVVSAIMALLMCLGFAVNALAEEAADEESLPAAAVVNTNIPCRSAILIEQSTGRVLFEKDADTPMPPASITKIMTLLLVMEAIDTGKIKLDDMVTCSPHASSMGGTQIWFEPGEQMTVHELLKATAIASANDASVALGEFIAGSEEGFVDLMNKRAKELGWSTPPLKTRRGWTPRTI